MKKVLAMIITIVLMTSVFVMDALTLTANATDNAAQIGWLQNGKTWYYMNTQGVMLTGWQQIGGTWYYFNTTGAMATGTVKIGSKTYNFSNSGACLNP